MVAKADIDRLLGLGLGHALGLEGGLHHGAEVPVENVRDTLPANRIHGENAIPGV